MGKDRKKAPKGKTPKVPAKRPAARPPSTAMAKRPQFSFRYADRAMDTVEGFDGAWGFHQDEAGSHQVLDLICTMSGKTWGEIRAETQDGHKKHHDMAVAKLCPEAQKRIHDRKLDQTFDDTIFRFREGNTTRLWGFVVDHVFHVLWWDPEHEIYPV